jgi:hypothetical protein
MSSSTSNPVSGGHGVRKNGLAGCATNSEFNARHLQIQRLVTRFGLSEPVARAVAAHAFNSGRRRA